MSMIDRKIEEIAAKVAADGEATRSALYAAFSEFRAGVRIDGAAYKPVAANAINYGGPKRLVGWSLRAVGGPVVVNFRDGQDVTGDVLGTLALEDGRSHTTTILPAGVSFASLFVEVTSTGAGTVVGAVWLSAVD